MPGQAFLAWDLGAESGRAIIGVLDRGRLVLHEIHRFAHAPARFPTGYYWDLPGMWQHMLDGTRKAAAWCKAQRVQLASVGVDTWGVDCGLLDEHGELLGLPIA